MKNLRLFTLIALLTFGTVSFAADPGDFGCPFTKPDKCPDLANIIAGKVGKGVIFLKGEFFAGRRHMFYGTTNIWTFILGPVPAPDKDTAYTTALTLMPTLTFLFGPTCSPLSNWICVYNTPAGVPAVAATPQLTTLHDATSLLKG